MQKLLKNQFFQGSIFLTAATFIMGIMNYVFNVLAARLLGPDGYGNVTTLFAYLALITIPLGAIGTVLIQKIGARGNKKYAYAKKVEEWVFMKWKKWWFVFLLPLLITPFMPFLTNLTPVAAYSIIPIVLISTFAIVYDGMLTALQVFFWSALIGIFTIALKLVGVSVGYITPNAHIAIILIFDISILLKTLGSKWLFDRELKNKPLPVVESIQKRLSHGLIDKHFLQHIGSILAITILNNIDIIYAKKILGAEAAGFFGAWALFAKVIMYAFAPLLTMSYVFLSDKIHEKYHRIFTLTAILILTMIGIVTNLGYGYFDRTLIKLFFGEKFIPLKPFIEWAALFGTGYVMVMFMNYYFLAKASKSTYILPVMIPFYLIGLVVYAKDLGSIIFLNTFFIFSVLAVYLLAFFKDKVIALFR